MKTYLFVSYFLFALLGACQNSPAGSVQLQNTTKTYETYCAGCHGQQLQRFKLLKTQEKSVDQISQFVKNGKLDDGMPAFGAVFSDEQVSSLAQYIKDYDFEENYVTTVDKSNLPYTVVTVVDNLEVPWGLEFLPNGDLLIAEREGDLIRYSKSKGKVEITGVPEVRAKGQGGLMDIKLHPDYKNNGWLYIAYSYVDKTDTDLGNTAIIRARLEADKLVDQETIYWGDPASKTNRHFGSRMVFDSKGYLYLSNGDRGQRDDFPQKLDNTNGKIHRLHDDGRIPSDNPFVGQANAKESIYSYGHRNPQGLAIHPLTGEVWEHEHGPKGGDEINIIKKGENYGWPIISYGINYSGTKFTDITEKEGMLQPVHYYVPSIAPCGMAFITSNKYPGWENNLLIGSLKFNYLERIQLNGDLVVNQEKLLEELNSRVRNVAISPDGYIYVGVEEPGRILKLLPKE